MAFSDHGQDGGKSGELSEAVGTVHRALAGESRDLDSSPDFAPNLPIPSLRLWFLT